MLHHAAVCSARRPAPAEDIDWELLALLARTEAALNRSHPTLPDGFDLSHPGDFEWICRVAGVSDATAPGWASP